MATQTKDPMTEMFQQLSDGFSNTFKTGMKFQQDMARFWTDMAGKNVEEVRENFQRVADQSTPFNKTSVEKFQKMFDEQAEQNMRMLKETFEAARFNNNPAELYDNVANLWRKSFDNFKASTEMMARSNSDMMDNWTKMCQNVTTQPDAARPAARGK